MPLFNKKFETKPIPPRLLRNNTSYPIVFEELDDYKNITLNLGNKEVRFAEGIWLYASRKGDVDDFIRLNRRLKSLEEENNMSELKIEVLLDLLAEHATELNNLKRQNI